MPPNPDYAEQVSVFHFTNRISSAKIRKYKMATERGMSNVPGGGPSSNTPMPGAVVTPAPQVEPAGDGRQRMDQTGQMGPPIRPSAERAGSKRPSTEDPPGSEEPASKKPKLKLKVREPDASLSPASAPAGPAPGPTPSPAPPGDNITVGSASAGTPAPKPRRSSDIRFRYSENMKLDDPSLKIDNGNESSDLSSAPPSPPAPKEPSPAPDADYGYLMSFYVEGGADDHPAPPKKAPPKKKPKHKQHNKAPALPPAPAPQPAPQNPPIPHQMMPPPPGAHQHRPHTGPPPPHPAQFQQPPPPPVSRPPPQLQLPQVQLIDFDEVNRDNKPRPPSTVNKMVCMLQALSNALTNFGGVPPVPKSPAPDYQGQTSKENDNSKNARDKDDSRSKDNIDALLGLLGDEDDSDKGEEGTKSDAISKRSNNLPNKPNQDYLLPRPGDPDGPLTYGIQFIQNALKSWAQQRLQHQYHGDLMKQAQNWQQQQLTSQKRGPGRPRKFPTEEVEADKQSLPSQPPPFQIRMESTPEGVAIKAFQHVLDSGCLQVNAMLPIELTTALRHLYMQIDHLINQGAKNEPEWQCMSYGAQIAANRVRVEKWKEAQARAHEEMARQQQLSHQSMMRSMGIAQPQPEQPPLTAEQRRAQEQAREIELDRRRSMQLALQQPQVSANMLNPMQFSNQPHIAPAAASHASSPRPSGSQTRHRSQPASPAVGGTPNSNGKSADQVKMYPPNLTPRSGASMKFSFPPPNAEAARAFGADAFPSNGQMHINGPAASPPLAQHVPQAPARRKSSNNTSTRPTASEVRPSIETATAKQPNGEAPHTNGESKKANQKAKEVVNVEDDADTIQVKQEVRNTPVQQIPTVIPATTGFTAVNALPQKRQASASASRPSSAGGGNAGVKKSKMQKGA
ncbi:hypothetical protein D0863_06072 [Hortaea werneckii]|uniref:Uncharacterized protein n=1 Tax=Hortaea werneckii TaxID=91943 RepID=A0A3M7E0S6_HORWE|nr:hypothetical protein D0863_06072 [Hortaea werneckii]